MCRLLVCGAQCFMVMAIENVMACIIGHILEATDVFLETAFLLLFMCRRCDIGVVAVFFKPAVIFFAFITGIGYNPPILHGKMLPEILQKGISVVESEGCGPTVTQVMNPASTPY